MRTRFLYLILLSLLILLVLSPHFGSVIFNFLFFRRKTFLKGSVEVIYDQATHSNWRRPWASAPVLWQFKSFAMLSWCSALDFAIWNWICSALMALITELRLCVLIKVTEGLLPKRRMFIQGRGKTISLNSFEVLIGDKNKAAIRNTLWVLHILSTYY